MKKLKMAVFLLLCMALLFAFASCSKGGEGEQTEGLAMHLAFNETGYTALDSAGKNSPEKISYYLTTAVFTDSVPPQRRTGVKESALWFDGWSTGLVYDDFEMPESFTVSTWIAPRSWEYPDGQIMGITGKYNSGNMEGFLLGIRDYGSWGFSFGTGVHWITLDAPNNRLERFKWTHLAASYDKQTNVVAIYRDGEIVNSMKLPDGEYLLPTTESLTIGKNTFARTENSFQLGYFNGLMDEYKIYDHALALSDIRAEFLSCCDKNGNVPECKYEALAHDPSLLRNDIYLPQYHISPSAGWMNEPIAAFEYKGVYHMFYQSTPNGPYWRYTQWGHWVSEDMVNWREVQPILFPEPDGMVNHHVFSGNAVKDADGVPWIIYTGVNLNIRYLNRISYAVPKDPEDPYLTEWERSSQPLFDQPADCSTVDFRDPYIYTEDGYAYMFIGTSSAVANFQNGNPRVVCYKASLEDLTDWTYMGVSYEASFTKYRELGYDWELPVLTHVKSSNGMWDKYVLFASPKPDSDLSIVANVYYWLGDFNTATGRFTPESNVPTRLDLTHNQVLVVTNMYENGENTLYGLMNGGQTVSQIKQSGWTNYVTLGKSLSLDNNTGDLIFTFHEKYESLHKENLADFKNMTADEINSALSAKGDMLHIKVEYDVSQASGAGINFRKSELNEFFQQEITTFLYDCTAKSVNLDTTRSGVGTENGVETIGDVNVGDKLQLDIYLDRSCVEIIVNGRYNMTISIRPTFSDALSIELTGDAAVNSLQIWSMEGTR